MKRRKNKEEISLVTSYSASVTLELAARFKNTPPRSEHGMNYSNKNCVRCVYF